MTGGGFGGSVIALVPAAAAAVSSALTAAFSRAGWRTPTISRVWPAGGAARLTAAAAG